MSHNIIRKDKTCLNCRHVVQERYCPNCGQENIESRKTFHELFIHFFEDLTHYENAFWKTIKNLLFKPASLTKEYLSGKRLSYLAPVRLYIFISFITFFLLAVLPDTEYNLVNLKRTTTTTKSNSKEKIITKENINLDQLIAAEKLKEELKDSLENSLKKSKIKESADFVKINNLGVNSIKQLDSIQKYGKEVDKFNALQYWIIKKVLLVTKKNTRAVLVEKFKESFVHNFSKTLFIYMPLFAFFLWLFHGKKRWYYFDHGIFTLHYFSFILLVVLIVFLFGKFLSLFGTSAIADVIKGTVDFVSFAWMFYYFFPAHHRFYGESRLISFIKSVFLFFINIILIVVILILFALYTFINIH